MEVNRTRAATVGLLAPAALALGMSADTSYRYLGQVLLITGHAERAFLCGVAEAAIIALTVYAWATRTKGPAYLAYAAVLVQAIPAFQVSGAAGGPVRVVLGPVLLAVLLHLLLGLELRMSGRKPDGLLASALREVRERLTAYLGIGRRGADSAAIARSRAADRAVDLVDRVAAARPGGWTHRRLSARLAAAIDAARHGLSPAEADRAEAAIVARVVRRKSVTGLASIDARHDWTTALASQAREVAGREAGGERREISGREVREIEGEILSREIQGDVTMYAASLLSHEPPPWADLSLRQAVAKADELIPGLSATDLSEVLAQIGVTAQNGDKPSPGSIRSTRSALRRTVEANGS
jgi:hypothetical protein